MSYTTSLAVDLLATLLLTALAVCAAAVAFRLTQCPPSAWPRSSRLFTLFVLATAAAMVAKAGTVGLLAQHGWIFVDRRLAYHLPMVAVPVLALMAVALPWVRRVRRLVGSDPSRVRGAAQDARLVVLPLVAAAVCVLTLLDLLIGLGASRLMLLAAAAVLAAVVAWRWRLDPDGGGVVTITRGVRLLRVGAVALAVAVPGVDLASSWLDSRLPDSYDLGALAAADFGGPGGVGTSHAVAAESTRATRSVTGLTGPQTGIPDVRYVLTASERTLPGLTGNPTEAVVFNGSVPGPLLRARAGDLIEVVLRNRDVERGVTIHWHGYDVPNAEDGVAGVTQNAVLPGGSHVYRFRAEQVGTFWYHAHQASSELVAKGLYGGLVVTGRDVDPDVTDLTVIDHAWRGPGGFLEGAEFDPTRRAERRIVNPGEAVRLRVINSSSTPGRYWLEGAPYRVVAVDGTDLTGPTRLQSATLFLAAGGRYDLEFTMPAGPVTLGGLGQGVRVVLGEGPAANMPRDGPGDLDLARYGESDAVPFGLADRFDRTFEFDIDRQLAFKDGLPGYQWSVNGETYPRMPMFMVEEGDTVRIDITNRTAAHHPIHLHGHHALVLERNGKPVTGSPWWTDTLNVAPGERYVVAFQANNPGIWMDHCHDLRHAAAGFVMHLGYAGVSTPFRIGRGTPNQPE